MKVFGMTAEECMEKHKWYDPVICEIGRINGVEAAVVNVKHDVLFYAKWIETRGVHCKVFQTRQLTTGYPVANDDKVLARACIMFLSRTFPPYIKVIREEIGPQAWLPKTQREIDFARSLGPPPKRAIGLKPAEFVSFDRFFNTRRA